MTLAFLRHVRGNTPEIDLVHDNLASVTDTVVAQGAFVILELCRKCLTLDKMVMLVKGAHHVCTVGVSHSPLICSARLEDRNLVRMPVHTEPSVVRRSAKSEVSFAGVPSRNFLTRDS